MIIKQTIITASLFFATSLLAGEPSLTKSSEAKEFPGLNRQLTFRKSLDQKKAFKFNQTSFSGSGKEWSESEITGGGLFLNLSVFFPSKKYLNPYYESGDPKYGLGYDFEIGNFFRFAKIADGKFGVGLRATWLSLNYTALTDEGDTYVAFQVSPVRVGPQFAMALNDKMGIDVFYQLGFNYTQQIGSVEFINETITVASTHWGISHEVGAAFHYKVFSLGLGYRFGKLPQQVVVFDDEVLDEEFLDTKKYSIGSFRIALGFRF